MARKILLADDSVTAQNMGRKILADAGYEVITVNNGSAALKKIAEIKPDLIVLDVYMPGYSGLEVCQRLKEGGDTARIPILLTVGKLEPFKPEEAKRVRAEGFIVKPFEASELLSALTKLEDKMVPRSESSKPGRFARTIAAVEEGRYDKTMSVEEDSGWKNRIAFPSKKTSKAAEQEETDDSAIYNPVNKDLRTVVEPKAGPAPAPQKAEESRVDVGALAPEGLPKDVTPEEVAALAAAAAHLQGKITSAKGPDAPETKAAESKAEAPKIEAGDPDQHKIDQKAIEQAKAASSTVQDLATPVAEAKAERVPDIQPASEAKAALSEKTEEKSAEAAKEPAVPAPTTAEVSATIAALETPSATAPAATSEHESSPDSARRTEAEPVTMAAAAAAAQGSPSPRWTAVAVAVAAEESGIALEDEMRKAYAAYAASAGAESRAVETVPPAAAEVSPVIAPSTQVPAAVEDAHRPETTESSSISLSAPAEIAESTSPALRPAFEESSLRVKSFETVAAPEPETSSVAAPQAESASASDSTTDATPAPQPSAVETPAEAVSSVSVMQTSPEPTAANEPTDHEPPVSEAADSPVIENATAAVPTEAVEPAPAEVVASATAEAAEPVSSHESAAASKSGQANKEPDIAATTAAAWATWRRIRESGGSRDAAQPQQGSDSSSSSDEAAMAVAAGAEKAPEEGPEIASIVDSVLADLRPKIVEEISKKLKKK